jgi:hypothetical protein
VQLTNSECKIIEQALTMMIQSGVPSNANFSSTEVARLAQRLKEQDHAEQVKSAASGGGHAGS